MLSQNILEIQLIPVEVVQQITYLVVLLDKELLVIQLEEYCSLDAALKDLSKDLLFGVVQLKHQLEAYLVYQEIVE